MATPHIEYLNSMWQSLNLPQGHEKPLKQAFYNTAANIFIVLAAAVAVAVYFILAPFIRPLYWALLCGTFLYPFKRSLTNVLRNWLQGLQCSGTPIAVGLVVLPFQVGNNLAESMTSAIMANRKLLLGFVLGLPTVYLVYHFTPLDTAVQIMESVLNFLYDFMGYFSSNWVWTFVIAYMLCVVFLWKSSSQEWLRYLSAPVWASVLLHFASVAGPLRVPLFFLVVIVLVVGVVVQMGSDQEIEVCGEEMPANEGELTSKTFSKSATLEESPILKTPPITTSTSAVKPSNLTLTSSKSTPVTTREMSAEERPKTHSKEEENKSLVNQYFMVLIWAHIIVRLWMHLWIIVLLFLLPLFHLGCKKIVKLFQSEGVLKDGVEKAKTVSASWLNERQDILVPVCLRGLGSLLLKGDKKIVSILEKGLDQATSIVFILMLLIGTFSFNVIGAVQIQRESMIMITSAQNILNKTVNSEYSQWMPNAHEMRDTMDQVLQKTHEHGRNFIASKVEEFLPVQGSKEEKENIVNQVLEVWDKLYESMLYKSGEMNATQAQKPILPDLTDMNTLWKQARELLQISAAVKFVKENIGIFMSVLESVWTVVKGNMNLFFTVITSILSAVLGGGTAILNFVLSAIIFLTTLFYLLASSGDMYKPAEIFSNMSPGTTGGSFGEAVEQAISGVFKASLKMAAFYGLYTWLIHLIFGLNIVFIPSALAAMFAAIPFLGPYWAAFPAVIELWLVQGQGLKALLLFLAHMAPAYVVDTAIYREIEGGHPYVTGLAIAGGILFMGLEGALIGPIILCCLIVVVNMYSNMLKSDPNTPAPGQSARIPSLSTSPRKIPVKM